MSSLLRNLKCITIDVTGTLIAYRGELGDYYCLAAKAAGIPCPDNKLIHDGFKTAYAEMTKRYLCFGLPAKMPVVNWWRACVKNSFVQAGYKYNDETFESMFESIYSSFGSSVPYSVFTDSLPFLRWARNNGVVVGLVSNAEHRYPDLVLPSLGLNEGSEWDFGVFSGVVGVEKPDKKIFEIALEKAGHVAPEEALHIGDSFGKDFFPARAAGMHAVLLDRFKTPEAQRLHESGAPVFPDLVSLQEWLSEEKVV